MCSELITLPLKIIFQESLNKEKFPEILKRANVVPVHKKENKTFIINYCLITLLPIFGEITERLIYVQLFLKKSAFYTSSVRFSSRRFFYCPTINLYKLHLMKILLET